MQKVRKKVGIITFHASHNYGSCLQAYAMQEILKKLEFDPEIINFRTDRQKDMYTVFTKRKGLKYILKNLTHLFYFFPLRKKYKKFEEFINGEYVLSAKEYSNCSQLEMEQFNYDAFIAGSDQIWNPLPRDFDWAYYLTFVKEKPKIAYAPSFGPFFGKSDKEKLKEIIKQVETFNSVSVREEKTIEYLKEYSDRDISLVLDPTLLLEQNDWLKLIDKKPIVKGEYILLYTLFSNPEINKIAKKLSKKLKMKVVTTNFSNQYDVFTPYKKLFGTGPKEFLNLLYNAKFVLATSFHGTVFSILFNKPFLVVNGDKDNRISTLLSIANLTERTVNLQNVDKKEKIALDVSFEGAQENIRLKREESIEYLKTALN